MCSGDDCPVKNKCLRYAGIPSKFRQSYFLKPPFKDDKCDMFWGEGSQAMFNQLKKITNN